MLLEVNAASTRAVLTRLRVTRSRLGRSRLAATAAILVALAGLFWAYLYESRTQGVNSDASSMVLLGWDMTHGNPLLRGWLLADVSFWTFEAPVDGLVSLVAGLRSDVVHVTAALVYTLLVLSVALLAKGTARGREGAIRGLLAAGVVVAPAMFVGAHVLLLAPDHTGIAVPVLLALLVLDRAPRRPWVPLAVGVLLLWAQLDDPVGGFAGALPLTLVCGVRAIGGFAAAGVRRIRRARRGLPGPPDQRAADGRRVNGLARPAYDAALALAAAASYQLTALCVAAVHAAGGFQLSPIPGGTSIVPWSQVGQNLQWTGKNLLYLFGGSTWGQPAWLGILHWPGVAVAVCGLIAGIVSLVLPSRADRVTQTLTVGTLVMVVAGTLSHLMTPVGGAHEIAIVLPFGAVLAGRTVGRWLAADHKTRARRVTAALATPAFALVGLGYLAQLGYSAAQPWHPAESQGLSQWLLSHGLTSGIGGYWQANSVTVESGGLVHVAPVNRGGKAPYAWESKFAWYDPTVSNANFFVTSAVPGSAGYATPLSVRGWFGEPQRVYQFSHYTIMTYDYNLLTRVLRVVPPADVTGYPGTSPGAPLGPGRVAAP